MQKILCSHYSVDYRLRLCGLMDGLMDGRKDCVKEKICEKHHYACECPQTPCVLFSVKAVSVLCFSSLPHLHHFVARQPVHPQPPNQCMCSTEEAWSCMLKLANMYTYWHGTAYIDGCFEHKLSLCSRPYYFFVI